MSDSYRELAQRVVDRCKLLAGFSEDPDSTRRTFLSSPMRDCHREITGWLEALGAAVRIDAAGNLRAWYSGVETSAPRLLLGSHLDTVPNAGAYDGVLGVVLAVALLEGQRGRKLPFGIEVLGLSEEEGVRFGAPFIGSRALVGRLDEELLRRKDAHGVSVREAIEDFGLAPNEIPEACVKREETLGYVEFHIEQGPVLEQAGRAWNPSPGRAGYSSRLWAARTTRALRRWISDSTLWPPPRSGSAKWNARGSALPA